MTNAKTSGAKGALVPTGGTINKTYADRCLLVGDSAGMVSPLTGGGIAWAMRAAKMACKTLAKALEEDRLDGEHLFAYQKMWESDFGRSIHPQLIAQKILTTPAFDVLLEISLKNKRLQETVMDAFSGTSVDMFGYLRIGIQTLISILRGALF